jgi:hypothetical protein
MPDKADNETKIVWPAHARLLENKHKTEIIHEFLEWCEQRGMALCKISDENYSPIPTPQPQSYIRSETERQVELWA